MSSSSTTPRWVRVSAVVAAVVLLLLLAVLVLAPGEHGPGRHLSAPVVGGAGVGAPWS